MTSSSTELLLYSAVNIFVCFIAYKWVASLFSVYEENPPLSVVQRFVHLLDTSDADYAEELGQYGSSIFLLILLFLP